MSKHIKREYAQPPITNARTTWENHHVSSLLTEVLTTAFGCALPGYRVGFVITIVMGFQSALLVAVGETDHFCPSQEKVAKIVHCGETLVEKNKVKLVSTEYS
jgi:hypothetical protein